MLNKIKDTLLQHYGKNNPITSSEIANIIGVVEDDTHAQTRALILECAERYELPLAANNKGYYIISNQQEYDDYMANLNSRSAGIEKRKRIITENYRRVK